MRAFDHGCKICKDSVKVLCSKQPGRLLICTPRVVLVKRGDKPRMLTSLCTESECASEGRVASCWQWPFPNKAGAPGGPAVLSLQHGACEAWVAPSANRSQDVEQEPLWPEPPTHVRLHPPHSES
eukprot:81641-Chlamydomonas_euryale.AAC.17